jgi:membrane protein YqaA with SNARE-associated domain
MGPIFDIQTWAIMIILSLIGLPVALGKYYVGAKGLPSVQKHFSQVTDERWDSFQDLYRRHGSPLLLGNGIPVVGILISTGAGAFGVPRKNFLIWSFMGKMLRNWVFALIALAFFNLFS